MRLADAFFFFQTEAVLASHHTPLTRHAKSSQDQQAGQCHRDSYLT